MKTDTQPLTDATVQLTGEDGNAFFIIGRVSKAIKQSNRPDLADAFRTEAMSGDYDNVLRSAMKYVEVR